MTPEERAEARRLLDDHELSNAEPPHGAEHYLRLALDALEQAERDLAQAQRDREQMRAMLDREAALLRACIQTRTELGEKWLAARDRAGLLWGENAELRAKLMQTNTSRGR